MEGGAPASAEAQTAWGPGLEGRGPSVSLVCKGEFECVDTEDFVALRYCGY